jgi:hypothetical protein
MRYIVRHPESPNRDVPRSRVEIGPPIALATGTATMNEPMIRPLSAFGNQYVRYRIIPGKNPASAMPRRNRPIRKLNGPWTAAIPMATTPQVTMMRAIQTRAPTLWRIRLLGTSKRKYPMKKMPAPRPNALAERPMSAFMVSAA